METLIFLREYNGLIVAALAIIFWLWKSRETGEDNSSAINRLEKSINELVSEIKVLVNTNNGINIKLENHEVRIVSNERSINELQQIKYQLK